MVKLKGPGMAMDAAGGLGKAVIFSQAKGRSYAKVWRAPANPRTGGQLSGRAVTQFISSNWKLWPPGDRQSWEALALDRNVSPLNACLAYNLRRIRNLEYPATFWPGDGTGQVQNWVFWSAVAVSRGIQHTFSSVTQNDGRGWIVHRTSPASGPRLWDNFVRVVSCIPWTGSFFWLDHVPPGTYHYKARVLSQHANTQLQQSKGPIVVP